MQLRQGYKTIWYGDRIGTRYAMGSGIKLVKMIRTPNWNGGGKRGGLITRLMMLGVNVNAIIGMAVGWVTPPQ